MYNRLRIITAFFLVKNLHIDWRWGEKYFQKMLVDYDAVNSIGGWQWAASAGADTVPYFRILNPIIRLKKFDNDGQFIKEHVPELKQMPQKYIHQSNLMSEALQTQYHVYLGENYLKPIVGYASSKKQTLLLYETSREVHQEMNNPKFQ